MKRCSNCGYMYEPISPEPILRYLRTKDMSAEEFGRRTGIHSSMISHWKHGKKKTLNYQTAERICEGLDIDMVDWWPHL